MTDTADKDGRTFVVVGGGLAGAKAVEALRDQGFTGRLVLVSAESELPYDRPPLSKGFLQGKKERDTVFLNDRAWYDERDAELRLGTRVTAIDRTAHTVALDDGSSIEYAKLLLATGSQPRPLPVAGADLDGVLYLRELADSERIKETIARTKRIVVIGAGWIGLEVAAAARKAGNEVTVIELAELPLVHALGRELGQIYADMHRAHGVDLHFGTSVDEILGADGRVTGVRLADGSVIDADAVVVGAGAAPRTELAEAAGLRVDNGVVVDSHLRTDDADIFAAGDIAHADNPLLGRSIRVEHWANALNQPKVAATSMLGGDAEYDRLPYFYSDQFEINMEFSGLVEADGYDKVVFRGDVDAKEFVAFWTKDGRVLAGMNVNIWDVTGPIQDLIRAGLAGKPVDLDRLADPSVALDSLL